MGEMFEAPVFVFGVKARTRGRRERAKEPEDLSGFFRYRRFGAEGDQNVVSIRPGWGGFAGKK